MNERIQELHQQAKDYINEMSDADGVYQGKEYMQAVREKFAELIVEECEAKHFSEGYLCGKKDGRFLAIHECSEYLRERGDISRAIDLREHFGVK